MPLVGMTVSYARLFTIAHAQTGIKFVAVIWNGGVSAVVYRDTIWIFTLILSVTAQVSRVPLNRVPLYALVKHMTSIAWDPSKDAWTPEYSFNILYDWAGQAGG